MKWYKRFSSFSSTPEVFRISPLAHLVYTVICDMTAGFDCDGLLPAKYIDDCEYLAHKLHMRLVPEPEYEAMKTSNLDIGMLHVTHSALLSRCVQQLCDTGLLSPDILDEQKVYKVPGFTSDNVAYLSDSTVRQRKHREKTEKNVTHTALPSRSVTHTALLSHLEEKRREEKENKENIVADATNEKPTKRKKAASKEENPRIESLKTALAGAWLKEKGSAYAYLATRDNRALKSLIGLYTSEEILECWTLGIKGKGWQSCTDFAELFRKFGVFQSLRAEVLKTEQKSKADADRIRQMTEFQEWIIADKLAPSSDEEAAKWDAYIEYYKTKQQARFIRARELLWQPGGGNGTATY